MQVPRQLINLIGAIVIAAVLAAGVLLGALPLYSESTRLSAEADSASSNNALLRSQVDALLAQQDEIDGLNADVASLREQIPATANLDDVFEVVAEAAAESGVTLLSLTGDPAAAWVPQLAPLAPTEDGAPAPAVAAETTDGAAESDSEASAEGDATADGGATEGGAASTEAPDAEALPPQQTVALTITAKVATAVEIVAFIDALGAGPRLISIVHTQLDGDNEESTLIVNALTFIRTES